METLVKEAVKHIYSIEVFAIIDKLSNTTFKGFVGRKVGDAFEVEIRLRQHENAVTLRFTNKLDIPIPGKRDHDIHEILKNDPFIQWDGEADQGYFTGREVFYMKDPNADVTYIDQKILDWATGKIQPVDDYTKRQNWFKEKGFNLSRIQRRIVDTIVNRYERALLTKGQAIYKFKHLLEAVPRSGKSVMALYIAKRIGAKRILIITPFPDADGSFKEIIEFHPDFPNGKFSDARSFKNGNQVKFNDLCSDFQAIMMSWQNLSEEKEKFNDLFDSKIDFVIVDETHRQADSERSIKILDRFYESNPHLPILHLSGTPYNDILSGLFGASEITRYDFLDKWRDVLTARELLKQNKYSSEEEKKELEYIASFPDIKVILVDKIRDAFIQAQTEYPFEENAPIDVFFSDPQYKTERRFFFEGLAPKKEAGKIFITKSTLLDGVYRTEFAHIMMFFETNAVCDMIKLELEELTHTSMSGWFGYEIFCISGKEEQDDYKNLENDINDFQNKHQKTIILSVGKATTGLTMKKLSSVWIMRNMRSAELFMQILFRLGTPCYGKSTVNVVVFNSEAIISAVAGAANARAKHNKNESLIKIAKEMSQYIPLLLFDGLEYAAVPAEEILTISRDIAQTKRYRISQNDILDPIKFKSLNDFAMLAAFNPSKYDFQVGLGGQKVGRKYKKNRRGIAGKKHFTPSEEKELIKIYGGIEYILGHMDWVLDAFSRHGHEIDTLYDITKLTDNDFNYIDPFVIGKQSFRFTKEKWLALLEAINNDCIQEAIQNAKIKFFDITV